MGRSSRRGFSRPVTAVSALLVVAAAVPLGVIGVRYAERSVTLARLDHPQPTVREAALNDLYRMVTRRPDRAAAAAERIGTVDVEHLDEVLAVLRRAGVVRDPKLQDALARRLVGLPNDAFLAAAAYAAYSDQAGTARDTSAVRRLQDPAATEAQRLGLVALLERAGTWRSPPIPPGLILEHRVRGLVDPDPVLRQFAVRSVGELILESPELSVARLASALRPALGDSEPAVRYAAATSWAGLVGRDPFLRRDLEAMASDDEPAVRDWVDRLLRLGTSGPHPEPAATADRVDFSGATPRWRSRLHRLESAASGSLVGVVFDPAMPHLVRIAATRAAPEPEPDWLIDTLRLDGRSAARDLACVVAAERFDEAQLDALVGKLLNGFDPEGRVSGAVLAGLTGRRVDLLRQVVDGERDPVVLTLMRVGLWMASAEVPLDGPQVGSLLGRDGVPDSTVGLALLHRGGWREVLDGFFRLPPAGLPGDSTFADADRRLRAERWALVLNRYLPPDAPRPDPGVAWPEWVEQREDLRAWHALHRGRDAWGAEFPAAKPGDSVP